MTLPADLTPPMFRPIVKTEAEKIISAIQNAGSPLSHGELLINPSVDVDSTSPDPTPIGSITLDVKEGAGVHLFASLFCSPALSNGTLYATWLIDGVPLAKFNGATRMKDVGGEYPLCANGFAPSPLSAGPHTFQLVCVAEPISDDLIASVAKGSVLLAQEVGPNL